MNYIFSRNSFRDLAYFNNKDKKRIYKSYFCVENKKKENRNKYCRTLNNEKINLKQKNLLLEEIKDDNYNLKYKERIINSEINKKEIIFIQINKYKNEINKLKEKNYFLKSKLNNIKEENKKIKIYLEKTKNKNYSIISNLEKLISSINYSYSNKLGIDYMKNDLLKILQVIKNEFNEKNIINEIINLIKQLYLEYNYSFSSNETKKIINYNEISHKILWDWIKNIPKLIFYEKIKNNLDKNKVIYNKYEGFIKYLFTIFEVDSIKELNFNINKIIKYK